jgi:hypothetical protein
MKTLAEPKLERDVADGEVQGYANRGKQGVDQSGGEQLRLKARCSSIFQFQEERILGRCLRDICC